MGTIWWNRNRKGFWKANKMEKPFGSGNWKLYNLKTDISEQNDIVAEAPEIIKEMKNIWKEYEETNNVILPNTPTAYDNK
ncbi:hypothetical protein [Aquimarina sp. I32.4]|uniref:hypothetical protein n=1 Tax=Aquimarina sp. I32.4 TaxID=2053903 RepID=UPI000CDEF9FA|nr:hypothetical protein [Aquimarina sp. I32.4]